MAMPELAIAPPIPTDGFCPCFVLSSIRGMNQVISGRLSSKMRVKIHHVDLMAGDLNLRMRSIRNAPTESHSEWKIVSNIQSAVPEWARMFCQFIPALLHDF